MVLMLPCRQSKVGGGSVFGFAVLATTSSGSHCITGLLYSFVCFFMGTIQGKMFFFFFCKSLIYHCLVEILQIISKLFSIVWLVQKFCPLQLKFN
jgi:hypothetical protein